MPANPDTSPHTADAVATPLPYACDCKQFDAEQLFAGTREIVIRHDGERYQLRRTSKGKLILMK